MSPVVIAHRGASGYLPEHTLEAKVLAYGLGADFIEQDVIATRDGVLIVLHDAYLDFVTDAEERFPERRRSDGRIYAMDLDLDEIRSLRVHERRRPGSSEPVFPDRFPRKLMEFRISTFDEELRLIQGLNHSTGRDVGVYPEIKDPALHAEKNIDLAHLLLTMLEDFGYRSREDNVFVQCFDAGELRRVREELGTDLKLTQLLADDDPMGPEALGTIAEYADGVGLPYSSLIRESPGSVSGMEGSGLSEEIHDAGLVVHPYTFRRDRTPAYAESFDALLAFFYEVVRVDGLFCDHPDDAVRIRDALRLDSG
jgi:glycerophosphoryl diester phosphodiesterase